MSAISFFHPADNEDGYVTMICLRERYQDTLLAMGWVKSVDDLPKKDEPKAAPQPKRTKAK